MVVVKERSRNWMFRSGGDGGVRSRPSSFCRLQSAEKAIVGAGEVKHTFADQSGRARRESTAPFSRTRGKIIARSFGCSSLKCGLYEPAGRIFGREHEGRKASVTSRSSMMVAEAALNEAVAVRVRQTGARCSYVHENERRVSICGVTRRVPVSTVRDVLGRERHCS